MKEHQAATHLSPMSAASIQPCWNSSSRVGTERVKQQFAILRSELDSAAPAPATPAHQVPGEPSGKEQPATTGAGEGWDEEQGKSAKRVCGTQRHGGSQPRFSSWC